MKATKTVEETCQLIEKYKLMSSKDYARMHSRWFRPDRKEAANTEEFRKWLVVNRYLTEFVAKVLASRKSDQLVLNQYRLQDQLISGPMAGSYLALDQLDRTVAIEVLSAASAADKSVLFAFQEAAHKAMEVQHQNVGRIVDFGEAHGLHYLVKEYYEGQSLEEILEKRGKLPYLQATRLMVLALNGLQALHANGVPAGDLALDCLLLTQADKGDAHQRTVKILHAGVKRRLFDEMAIGRSISMIQGIPDELQLASSCTFQVSKAGAANPAEDIFRLGCIFYRCVTGQPPFAERDLAQPPKPARPVADLAPDVPEMLCRIIEEMIDPDCTKRPQQAAHVGKSLRVFLASEEESREHKAEENLVAPSGKAGSAVENEPEYDEEEQEEEEEQEKPTPRRSVRATPSVEEEGALGKATALWNEVQPSLREWLFLAGGALGMLLLIFVLQLLTGIRLAYIAGLATGMAVSYFVELYLSWRRAQSEGANA
jgi:eukaryotic-like serine/threonine-protein kinase